MKILFANKYHYLKGGAERYMFELGELLKAHGHSTVPFAMRDPKNLPSLWEKFFVSPVATESPSISLQGLRTAGRVIYSLEARRKFSALLEAAHPDLVHVHNIYHQISPSILPRARKRGIPVVMTAHDYKLIAPNYSLFHDGAICELTKPAKYWRAIGHKCVKGSAAASALAAAEMTAHRLLGLYTNNVDMVVAPSRFVKSLLEDYGMDPSRITHVPHFIDASAWTPRHEGEYALFVGRLSEEKGADRLVRAASLSGVPLHVVGTGPQEKQLKFLASEDGGNIVFRGFLDGQALRDAVAGARYVVVPSVWYEVFGLIVLEAYAAGKPVIASQIGGLAELVREGETGLHASAGDAADLADKMAALWEDPALCAEMGRNARAWVERDFTPERHYARLMEVYGIAHTMAAARSQKG